jgi:hypothetical protein
MLDRQSNPASDKVRVIAVTGDADLEQSLRSTFGSNGKIDLSVVQGSLLENGSSLSISLLLTTRWRPCSG